jgi:DNA-binding HxlR family transcriptional regulator
MKEIIYPYQCPVEAAFGFIGGKWKALIVWNIGSENRRFSELKQVLPRISPRILSRQLKTLERDGIIARKQYGGIPPRVEYTLTAAGLDLIPVLNLACEWAKMHYLEHVPPYGMKKI